MLLGMRACGAKDVVVEEFSALVLGLGSDLWRGGRRLCLSEGLSVLGCLVFKCF